MLGRYQLGLALDTLLRLEFIVLDSLYRLMFFGFQERLLPLLRSYCQVRFVNCAGRLLRKSLQCCIELFILLPITHLLH